MEFRIGPAGNHSELNRNQRLNTQAIIWPFRRFRIGANRRLGNMRACLSGQLYGSFQGHSCAPAAPLLAQQPLFGSQIDLGMIKSSEIDEASGLAASRQTPGVLWTHNDSGDKARLFAIDEQGELLMTCTLAGVTARDWEDIAIGRGAIEGESYLYIADIGDNSSKHDACYLYRFKEPAVALCRSRSNDRYPGC